MEQLGLDAADDAPPRRGDPRPARHRRPAEPARSARSPAVSSSASRSARCSPCTRGSSSSTSRPRRSTRPPPRTCWAPSPGWSRTSVSRCSLAEHRMERVRPVRRPAGRRRGRPGPRRADRARCSRPHRSRRPWSSSAASPGGSRCRSSVRRGAPPLARPARALGDPPTGPDGRRGGSAVALQARATSSCATARRSRSARSTLAVATGRGRRAHGPQRLGQVVAALGAAGHRSTRRRDRRWSTAPTRPRAAGRPARALVGLVPQTATDLLYLETVDDECAAADDQVGGADGTCRSLLDRLAPGVDGDRHPRDLSEGQRLSLVLAIVLTARPPRRRARRADPGPGLRRPRAQLADRSSPELAGDGTRRPGRHPRRRVRRPRRRPTSS